MSTKAFDGAYLLPLFREIEQVRGEDAYVQLPHPDPTSSLAADDAPLGPWATAHLVRASYTAGLAQAMRCAGSPWRARSTPPARGRDQGGFRTRVTAPLSLSADSALSRRRALANDERRGELDAVGRAVLSAADREQKTGRLLCHLGEGLMDGRERRPCETGKL